MMVQELNDVNGAQDSISRSAQRIIWISTLLALSLTIWAAFAPLDEVTSGQGKVVPLQHEQRIQSLEGGILRQLSVKADQHVEAGQILAELDGTRTLAELDQIRAQWHSRLATRSRLFAQVNKTTLSFPTEPALNADLIDAEQRLFEALQSNFITSLEMLERSATLLAEETAAAEALVRIGAAPRAELGRLEREYLQVEMQIDELKRDYFIVGRETLGRLDGEIAALAAEFTAKQDQLARLQILSPVRGTVKDITVTTRGGVIPPNGDLMTIVPLEDDLRVEARISPQDIAFIRPQMRASIKITAYDPAIYGTIEGEVVSISPDSMRDEVDPKQLYYRVLVRAEDFALKTPTGHALPVTPGMIATIDIHTGSRTVLQYLLKPFNRMGEALRER